MCRTSTLYSGLSLSVCYLQLLDQHLPAPHPSEEQQSKDDENFVGEIVRQCVEVMAECGCEGGEEVIVVPPRIYNRKCVQLPYGFCTRHLDGMTQQSAVNMLSRYLT